MDSALPPESREVQLARRAYERGEISDARLRAVEMEDLSRRSYEASRAQAAAGAQRAALRKKPSTSGWVGLGGVLLVLVVLASYPHAHAVLIAVPIGVVFAWRGSRRVE